MTFQYIGYPTVLLKPLDCYTSIIEKLITFPEFTALHLEVLLLHQCKALPGLKTGMAVNKCSTACIKELSKLMMQTKEWKLVKTLIEHGTVPDIKCIEIAIEQYGEERTLYLTHQVEKANHNICYDSLLSLAVCKKWNDKFVHHCLKQGAKFNPRDVWSVLKWTNDCRKQNLLKLMVSQDGAMDVQNDKEQLPLDFLLEQGMFNGALTLLELKIDTGKIDIIKTIKTLKKYNKSGHLIIKILNGIIENKKNAPNLTQDLTLALKYALANSMYDVAAILINHGADIKACVDKSTTVVHIATKIVLHVDGMYVCMCNYLCTFICIHSYICT